MHIEVSKPLLVFRIAEATVAIGSHQPAALLLEGRYVNAAGAALRGEHRNPLFPVVRDRERLEQLGDLVIDRPRHARVIVRRAIERMTFAVHRQVVSMFAIGVEGVSAADAANAPLQNAAGAVDEPSAGAVPSETLDVVKQLAIDDGFMLAFELLIAAAHQADVQPTAQHVLHCVRRETATIARAEALLVQPRRDLPVGSAAAPHLEGFPYRPRFLRNRSKCCTGFRAHKPECRRANRDTLRRLFPVRFPDVDAGL